MYNYTIEKMMMPEEKMEGCSSNSIYQVRNSNGALASYTGVFAWTNLRIIFASDSNDFRDIHNLTEIDYVSLGPDVRFIESDEYIRVYLGGLPSKFAALKFFQSTVKCTYHIK